MNKRFNGYSKWLPSAILDLLNVYLDYSRKVFGDLYRYAKFGWNRCSSFDNMEVVISCTFGLKTPIQYSCPKNRFFLGGGGYDPVNGMRYQQNSQNAHPWADGQTSYDARIVEIGRPEQADGVLNGPEKKTVWTMQCEWIGQFSTPPPQLAKHTTDFD